MKSESIYSPLSLAVFDPIGDYLRQANLRALNLVCDPPGQIQSIGY
jgi:hypothetical protein